MTNILINFSNFHTNNCHADFFCITSESFRCYHWTCFISALNMCICSFFASLQTTMADHEEARGMNKIFLIFMHFFCETWPLPAKKIQDLDCLPCFTRDSHSSRERMYQRNENSFQWFPACQSYWMFVWIDESFLVEQFSNFPVYIELNFVP